MSLKFFKVLLFVPLLSAGITLFAQGKMIMIPSTTYEVEDSRIGISLTVTISSFDISSTEITQREFAAVMELNPSYYKGNNRPVDNVSWWEAIRYCNLRSREEGLSPCYDLKSGACDFSKNGYRLPTNAEWAVALGNLRDLSGDRLRQLANLGSDNTKSSTALLNDLRKNATAQVASYPPNNFGLYDMLGNTWEWCNDYSDPTAAQHPASAHDPKGPADGIERVIRGGSYITLASGWNRGFISSMPPDHKSRFTGFRVSRSHTRQRQGVYHLPAMAWYSQFSQIPGDFQDHLGPLTSLIRDRTDTTISTAQQWSVKKSQIKRKWQRFLGSPTTLPPQPETRLLNTFEEDIYSGEVHYLRVEEDSFEKILIMRPRQPLRIPTPVVIVPYYDIDTPAGKNLGGRVYRTIGVRSFGYQMVQQGYMVVAIRWFGESYGEGYAEAVANLNLRHPGCTGLGKWVWDAQRLVDYLYTLPEVDTTSIGIIGHSLGAKMALYAAAMDERIRVVAFSEGGIGLLFSNYEDYWYLGEVRSQLPPGTDHHELLALIAPRPFLLIGGDSADNDSSWFYINAAREVYHLYGKSRDIGYYNHRRGHSPTPESVELAIEWLTYFLGRP